jgi:hypothetical protein
VKTPLERVLDLLDSVTGKDGKYSARCPAHDDQEPSLSVSTGDDGKVLLCCHAGCPVEAVVEALGLTMADLFPSSRNGRAKKGKAAHKNSKPPRRKPPPAGKSYPSVEKALQAADRLMARDDARRTGRWDYHTADGEHVASVVRYDLGAADGAKPEKTFRPISLHPGGWYIADPPGLWPLYNLRELGNNQRIVVVEGEKCADALADLGVIAVTSAHGAQAAGKTDWSPLAGRRAVILPDNDEPGAGYANDVGAILRDLQPAATVKTLDRDFCGDRAGDDAVELITHWREQGLTREQMRARLIAVADAASAHESTQDGADDGHVAGAGPFRPRIAPGTGGAERQGDKDGAAEAKPQPEAAGDADDAGEEAPPSVSGKLLAQAGDFQLFLATGEQDGTPYTSFQGESGALQTHAVASQAVRDQLTIRYYRAYLRAPSDNGLKEAIATLRAKAVDEGKRCHVALRAAERDGHIYIDLGSDAWQVVEVTDQDWTIIPPEKAPLRFTRHQGMLPLPTPERGGSLSELRPLVNISPDDENSWALLLAWLVTALRSVIACPVLSLVGEQGSAKSTLSRILRGLIDPHIVPLRRPPREVRDLMVSAANNYLLTFENLSHITADLSDTLCSLVTGGGASERRYYTNAEEVFIQAKRPVLINSIGDVVLRPDLLSRTLVLPLRGISDRARLTDQELEARLGPSRPRIFAAMLDAMVVGLRRLPNIRLEEKPRMADFFLWATACEPALGLQPGRFKQAHKENQQQTAEVALEGSPIYRYLVQLLGDTGKWEGRASDLLDFLNDRATSHEQQQQSWPKAARWLSSSLRNLHANLQLAGIGVTFDRDKTIKRDRLICIQRLSDTTPAKNDSPRDAGDRSKPPSRKGGEIASIASVASNNVASPENSGTYALDAKSDLLDATLDAKNSVQQTDGIASKKQPPSLTGFTTVLDAKDAKDAISPPKEDTPPPDSPKGAPRKQRSKRGGKSIPSHLFEGEI